MNNLLSPTNSIFGAETIRFLFRSKPKAYKNTTAMSISTNRMLFQFSFFIFCFAEFPKVISENLKVFIYKSFNIFF